MKPKRTMTAAAILSGGLWAPAALGQSYGTQAQVLTIGAAEFRSFSPGDSDIDSDGYVSSSGDHRHQTELSLPVGALVERVCVFVNDSDPSTYVEAVLTIGKLVSPIGGPDVNPVGERAASTADVGYGYYCSDPFSYVLRGKADVDRDGVEDDVVYDVYVSLPPATQNSLAFGGVQITWRREVSPPPPGRTFDDVLSTDPGFQYIEALAASGITAGCSPTNYCPNATLTRRQMAVFLSKALGLHWTD
jgi:hypothetical protein